MPRTILDVSKWQGRIDWDKVKTSGLVSGVMIRAMGTSKEGKPSKPYIDHYFARNYAECTRLGIPVGVYGYFKATTKAQADRELALFKQALGGWDTALQTLIIFMAIDYITGLIVAGVFHTSPKTKTGTLESRAGWKGLCRKGVSLLVVLVACRLDAVIGSNFIRDTVVIAFVCNETISIVENAGLMGVPIPAALTRAVDVLKQRAEEKNGS